MAKAESKPKLWRIKPIDGMRQEDIVEADDVRDAIREYNGTRTNYSRKQLVIEEA